MTLRYRPEIDGLRALAVLPVVLFHAGVPALPGGFIGVDIFFVISGYLITRQIVEERTAGTFTLAAFWERRARRILPALFVMMAACVPFAWVWLLPSDFRDFARSLVAATLFSSNVLFWRGSGYFDEASELQPLLHTWSLAVEEQWYLVFPLAMMALWRLGRARLTAVLAAVAVGSLVLSHWAALERPAAAFYLLPSRAWELLAGALLALRTGEDAPTARPAPRWRHEAAALAGLVLLVAPMFAFDRHTPFPGLPALAPVVGAVLAIRFATPATRVGRLLSNPALVSVGTFSYGTYLWHQPLFAFARQGSGGEPDPLLLAALTVAALALGWASLKFVERPFRDRSRVARRTVAATALSGALALCGAAAGILALGGAPGRYDPAAQALLREGDTPWRTTMVAHGLGTCFLDEGDPLDTLRRHACVPPPSAAPRLIIVGDSEAAHLAYGLRRRYEDGRFEVGQWTGTACAPIAHSAQSARCRALLQAFFDEVLPTLRPIDRIVVSADWLNLLARDGTERFGRSLREGLATLASGPATVIVVGDAPEFLRTPYELLVRAGEDGRTPASLRSRDVRTSSGRVRAAAQAAGLRFVDPTDALCRGDDPLWCRVVDSDGLLWFDARHLSAGGSAAVARIVGPAVEAEPRTADPGTATAASPRPSS